MRYNSIELFSYGISTSKLLVFHRFYKKAHIQALNETKIVHSQSDGLACLCCGSKFVIRTAYRGSRAGISFMDVVHFLVVDTLLIYTNLCLY